jgi:hypothetical protein
MNNKDWILFKDWIISKGEYYKKKKIQIKKKKKNPNCFTIKSSTLLLSLV